MEHVGPRQQEAQRGCQRPLQGYNTLGQCSRQESDSDSATD